MNKRIEELIVQAGAYVNETYTGPVPATFTGNPEWHKEFDKWTRFNEKFAQLIVEKCAGIIESQDVDPSFKLRMSWAVKQYFGVEQ